MAELKPKRLKCPPKMSRPGWRTDVLFHILPGIVGDADLGIERHEMHMVDIALPVDVDLWTVRNNLPPSAGPMPSARIYLCKECLLWACEQPLTKEHEALIESYIPRIQV